MLREWKELKAFYLSHREDLQTEAATSVHNRYKDLKLLLDFMDDLVQREAESVILKATDE